MEVLYSINQQELKANLQKMEIASEVKSVIILMTDDGICDPEFMNPILNSFSKPIIGGVFHEIIVNSVRKDVGTLLLPLNFQLKTEIFDYDLSESEHLEKMDHAFSDNSLSSGSIFVFEDAFVSGKTALVESLFNFFGFKFTFIGAGCGSYKFVSFPCVIHNSGVFANAGVIGLTSEPVSLGVAHGWSSISEPLKVTEIESNNVLSLNWEPAFDSYKRIVEKHSGKVFDDTNFLEIAKSYPLGMVKIDGEMVVRDPIMVENGILHFFDKIDFGQYLCVLHGNTDSLLAGAQNAKEKCIGSENVVEKNDEYVFCIDCFSRVKFLENDFVRELEVISGSQKVYGALTFGEIANVGDSFLEIYNKTVIVAKWNQTI